MKLCSQSADLCTLEHMVCCRERELTTFSNGSSFLQIVTLTNQKKIFYVMLYNKCLRAKTLLVTVKEYVYSIDTVDVMYINNLRTLS